MQASSCRLNLKCCQGGADTDPTGSLLHAAIGIEELGRPESPLLQKLVPHGYLHAMTCMGLAMYNCHLFTRLTTTAEYRSTQHQAIINLLMMGCGPLGILFFGFVFVCPEVYAADSIIHSDSQPSSMPSQPQASGHRPIKPGARSIKDIVEGRLGNDLQGIHV